VKIAVSIVAYLENIYVQLLMKIASLCDKKNRRVSFLVSNELREKTADKGGQYSSGKKREYLKVFQAALVHWHLPYVLHIFIDYSKIGNYLYIYCLACIGKVSKAARDIGYIYALQAPSLAQFYFIDRMNKVRTIIVIQTAHY